jgi:beta-glucosidase
MTNIGRRELVGGGVASLALAAGPGNAAAAPQRRSFPGKFMWGAATSGHQTEGNNVASDYWLMETVKPTMFAQASGDAANSFELWQTDLDIVAALGFNTYRFSLEWSRIEPEEGQFSRAMLDHYRRIIAGCETRGLKAVVTFNHFACPRWFAAKRGWLNPQSPDLFARFCERAARALAGGISHAITLNEPNLPTLLSWIGLPPALYTAHAAMLRAAGRAVGSDKFSAGFYLTREEHRPMIPNLGAAHRKARAAIKSARPDLPVGLTLALTDDQATGVPTLRDRKRAETYEPWFAFAADDEFIGVQNYYRSQYDANGVVAPPADAPRNYMGLEVYAPSLAGAVRYVAKASGKPVFITEHGVGTDDDVLRSRFIVEALAQLHAAMADGVRVLGYLHWSLLDNFEWADGFKPKFGLVAVDGETFRRSPKPSAAVLGRIAKANALQVGRR